MEEIYVIKMKGLPPSHLSSAVSTTTDQRKCHGLSRAHGKDLGREALLGFGLFQALLGLITVIFSSVDLRQDWYNLIGIFCGLIYMSTGLVGVFAAHKRRTKFIGSKKFIKLFLFGSSISLLASLFSIGLVVSGTWTVSSQTYPTRSMVSLSKLFQALISGLSVFTSSRILWPTRLQCCARTWPQKSNIKQKIIIATTIFARGLPNYSDEEDGYRQSLGPNCIVSLSVPQVTQLTRQPLPAIRCSNDQDEPNEYIEYEECDITRRSSDNGVDTESVVRSVSSASNHSQSPGSIQSNRNNQNEVTTDCEDQS